MHGQRSGAAAWIRASYLVKTRVRSVRDVAVHGGFKIGGHRRRVVRWSAWETVSRHRSWDAANAAADRIRRGLRDVAIFYKGTRVDQRPAISETHAMLFVGCNDHAVSCGDPCTPDVVACADRVSRCER